MIGFQMLITTDPTQVPNNQLAQVYETGVGIQNLSASYVVDLAHDDVFTPNSQFSYPLAPRQWYTYTGQKTFWAKINPVDSNGATVPEGASCLCWINPGGAANVGGVSGTQSVAVVSPERLAVAIEVTTKALIPKQNTRRGQAYSQIIPEAGRLKLFHAILHIENGGLLRLPRFELNIAGDRFKVPMVIGGLGPGDWEFTGIPGAFQPFQSGLLTVFPLPEIALPSETIISLPTINFDENDRWQEIWTQSEL
jgi:hypothetical protein